MGARFHPAIDGNGGGAGESNGLHKGGSPLAAVRKGQRGQHRPLRIDLRHAQNVLDGIAAGVHALRADPVRAASWMDWFSDNEYLVRRTVTMLGRDLSATFIDQLPVLAGGALAGRIRAHAIAHDTLESGDHRFDLNALELRLTDIQRGAALHMSELWALPLLLRFVSVVDVLEAASELLAMQADAGAESDEATPLSQRVISGIRNLHIMEHTDWPGFVERASVLHRLLSEDPAQAYANMDFATRDRYRDQVEKLARASGRSESRVARATLELAREAANTDGHAANPPAAGHVGYYLIGDGITALEARLRHRPAALVRLARWARRHAQLCYLGSIVLVASVLVVMPSLYATIHAPLALTLLVAVLVVVPAGTVASTLVNWLITTLLPPSVLPKMEFTDGVSEAHRTLVAISALVCATTDVDALLEQIERHYLTSRDPQLRFGLLTCFFDSDTQTTPRDGPLAQRLREGIDALNQRHGEGGPPPFVWLHRERVWSAGEGRWMGWERKRGKLRELNRLILTGARGSFHDSAGDVDGLRDVRYVLTLDADTSLPVDAAARLIGTIAHPLNQPVFDPASGRIEAGYTIIQPRTEIDPVTALRTAFTRIFSGDRGLDLYTLAVSDAYQDLFGEGLFTGKGLYVVDAFEASMNNAVPENALLSHDLFEGAHGRVALVSDVVLYEEYPDNYLAYTRRLHRWVRGDWQLLPWLGRRVPNAVNGRRRNRLTPLHRWQILHNLLRSLQAPVLVALTLLGWFTLPGNPVHWTALALITLLVPGLTSALGLIPGSMRRRRAGNLFHAIRGDGSRWLLAVCFMPHESVVVLDAAARALYRTFVSRRRMLQWNPAAREIAATAGVNRAYKYLRRMPTGPALSIGIGALICLTGRFDLLWGTPLLALWAFSPAIAYAVSRRPAVAEEPPLSEDDQAYLRRLARQTWHFFEQFVGPGDHWLPPDHFQEAPRDRIAHRTSPTNIGLLLLANVTAYDLGYIDGHECMVRTRNTLDTLEHLPKLRGHLFNWYETRTLKTLPPAYVSTVDSGNLLGCLIVIEHAAAELRHEPVLSWNLWQGLFDTLGELSESLEQVPHTQPVSEFAQVVAALTSRIRAARDEPRHWTALIDELESTVQTRMDTSLRNIIAGTARASAVADIRVWLERTHHHINALKRLRDRFLPWLAPFSAPPPAVLDSHDDEVVALWTRLQSLLHDDLTFAELSTLPERAAPVIDGMTQATVCLTPPGAADCAAWLERLREALSGAGGAATEVIDMAASVQARAGRLFDATDMGFLYDRGRHVFRIGYNLDRGRLDDSAYDLLASESRLASFLAIAKGDVPGKHWAYLGRPFTSDGPDVLLLSWSGTLFEYLMPQLMMNEPDTGLLGRSGRAAVDAQIRFARQQNLPWGVSESSFYTFDDAGNYGYQAFGVPALAIRTGKPSERVVAPYATFLALAWRPGPAVDNLRTLQGLGVRGRYGFYEAVDFTPRHMDIGATRAVVRSYMAHHQGMALVSVGNVLNARSAHSRFHADPRVQACELYLQERLPREVYLEFPGAAAPVPRAPAAAIPDIESWPVPVITPTPTAHVLSNGRYRVIATNGGGGESRWRDLALTRWRSDPTRDNWGTWIYLRDDDSGEVWSPCSRPCGANPAESHVRFHAHAVEYQRRDHGLVQTLEVTVSPTDDAEIRRLTLTNQERTPRTITFTSYAEVVLGDAAADARHQAFSKLFVRSEYEARRGMLVFSRRRRTPQETTAWMGEMLVTPEDGPGLHAYGTDRRAFLGRNGSHALPRALRDGAEPDNVTGDTLDPASILQYRVTLAPGETARLALVRIVQPSRPRLMEAAEHFGFWASVEHTFDDAYRSIVRDLHNLGIDRRTLRHIVGLGSALLYPNRHLRAAAERLAANRLGQTGLWGLGISGDYPIVLVLVGQHADPGEIRPLLKAYQFWRRRGLAVDVAFVEDSGAIYQANTRDALWRLVSERGLERRVGTRGGLFILSRANVDDPTLNLLHSAARVVLECQPGAIGAAVGALATAPAPLPHLPIHAREAPEREPAALPPVELQRHNGYGGFSADGREYVIELRPQATTPAPWSNVIANADFGFLVTESGAGCTWRLNSGENRLTPWRNDPVLDEPGEVIYLRDEETGALWCPTPSPITSASPCRISHGAGYSRFEVHCHGLEHELLLFAPPDAPVKIMRLRLTNRSGRARRLSATCYAEWVLGTDRATAGFVVPAYEPAHGALLARNPYSPEFAGEVAFLATTGNIQGVTADRAEFLGPGGSLRRPAALARIGLSGEVTPGGDPCAAMQVPAALNEGDSTEIVFLLGASTGTEAALALVDRYRAGADQIEQAWDACREHWDRLLGTITVQSPDPSLDWLCNRWLLYQTLSCRLHGRTALYQSSGAYGFRDQLQDAMALLHTAPEVCREQILRAAAHQFPEGDVLHWWHPPGARGVRTRISDDLLWLPYTLCEYLQVTGDGDILDQRVAFLEGEPLGPDEHERYQEYVASKATATVYVHCLRAIARADTEGAHGLPLMGGGDWNDGLNRVGAEGKGESVWLGWFLLGVLRRFRPVAENRGDTPTSRRLAERAGALENALRTRAWDGEWYLRAFFDDGTPLGSAQQPQCRIDAIAQAWSVLSGGDGSGRGSQAMAAAWTHLVDSDAGIMRLLTPPFTGSGPDPGYIRAYPPGVRENGGQYTHAAAWAGLAYASLGDRDHAGRLFGLLNPVNHAGDAAAAERYRVEPYVIAADVYANGSGSFGGRGGWTWYTGSAAWMYRFIVEGLLGVRREGRWLHVKPCLPPDWPGYRLSYRFGASTYVIEVTATAEALPSRRIELRDDGGLHRVTIAPESAVRSEGR